MLVRVMHSFVSNAGAFTEGDIFEASKAFADKGVDDGALMEFTEWVKSIASEHGYNAKLTKKK